MSAKPPHAQKRILLIDDDELVAGSLRQYLVRQQHSVDVALEPAVAEAMMEQQSYDVVLLDPYLTGGVHQENHELLESVCRLQPRAVLIVLTGYGSPELERIAAECHVMALLTKPQSVVFLGELIASSITSPPWVGLGSMVGEPRP